MMRSKTLLMMTLAAMAYAGAARAQTISYSYVTGTTGNVASNYFQGASGGGPITINLYLQETIVGGNGASSSLINQATGLAGGAVAVQAQGTQTASTVTNIGQNFAAIGSGGFGTGGGANVTYTPGSYNFNQTQVTTSAAAMTVNTGFTATSGPLASNLLSNSPNGGTVTLQILLGTITITPKVLAAGQSAWDTYQITSFATATAPTMATDLGSGYTATFPDPTNNYTAYNLDSTNNAAFGGGATYGGADGTTLTFTVAVPEPSSIMLCGLAGFSGVIGYYRRRKAARAASNDPAAV